ncbi:DUF4166 domain-containing protein [Aquimarina longa]|uniref:DUF4166 domain-containing protein n=1 Tax=Aquimarina longa TaxID=1080221 RepID=UPI000780F2AE|nr:DUF4166 domain-containing protein [Aquimarina longa]
MSAYKQQMGSEYLKLHPEIQKRFDFSTDNAIAFIGKGVMEKIWTGNKLTVSLLKLLSKSNILFPREGENIEYEIHNYPYKDRFNREVHSMNRVFFFDDEEQRFDGTALFSDRNNQIIEYLGLDQKIFFKMGLSVAEHGAIKFISGDQYVFILGKKIKIPSFIRGNIELLEWYDDTTERFYLDLSVTTTLLGPLFGFTGWFTGEYLDFKNKKLPEKFKPTYEQKKE